MSANVLADKDANAANAQLQSEMEGAKDVKNMDYHRQMLQAKLANGGYEVLSQETRSDPNKNPSAEQTYVSPSDNIMSPCTAKLSGLKSKHAMK